MYSIIRTLLALFTLAVAMPAQAALEVLATVPEWAALAQEIGGTNVKVYAATHALAGSAPHRGQAFPHRPRPQRRSGDRHRCRSGDRLAARRAARIRQRQGAAGPAGLLRGGAAGPHAGNPAAPRPRRRRRPSRRQSAHPDRSAQHPESGRGAGAAHGGTRSGQCAGLPGRHQDLRRQMARGDAALGERGGSPQGRAHPGAAQGFSLSHRLARHERGRQRSNSSPESNRRPRTSRRCWRACRRSRPEW